MGGPRCRAAERLAQLALGRLEPPTIRSGQVPARPSDVEIEHRHGRLKFCPPPGPVTAHALPSHAREPLVPLCRLLYELPPPPGRRDASVARSAGTDPETQRAHPGPPLPSAAVPWRAAPPRRGPRADCPRGRPAADPVGGAGAADGLAPLARGMGRRPRGTTGLSWALCLCAELGRRAAALRQYQRCVDLLRREVGTEPEPDTQKLYQEILRQHPGRRDAPLPSPAAGSPRPTAHAHSIFIQRVGDTPLIGRADELGRLEAGLEAALAGRGIAILVGHTYESEQRPRRPRRDRALGASPRRLVGLPPRRSPRRSSAPSRRCWASSPRASRC
jgi:hypothetical protein